jgi:hypothetical protein
MPGMEENEPYVMLRSGRMPWLHGKILSIISLAVVYQIAVFILLSSIVGKINFSFIWDRGLSTLALTDASMMFNINMTFSYKVIAMYSTAAALFLTVSLNLLLCIFSGAAILLINSVMRRPVGSILIFAFALLDQAIGGLAVSDYFYKVSPVSLASIMVINDGYVSYHPTLRYTIAFYLFGILLLYTCILYLTRRRAILIYPTE